MARKKSTKSAKTVKGTKKSPKKTSKMESLSQTHGREETFEPTTLDQIWGDKGGGKYQTDDAGHYEQSIREMNLTDMQMHATQVGLIPIQNRELLTKRLVKEFQKHWNSYKKPLINKRDLGELPQSVRDTLAEGR
jgi:hypothetical protein